MVISSESGPRWSRPNGDLVTRETIEQTHEFLTNPALRREWAATNYELGLKYFSYAVVRRKLAARLAILFGEGM